MFKRQVLRQSVNVRSQFSCSPPDLELLKKIPIRKIEKKNFLKKAITNLSSLLRESGERWPPDMEFLLLTRKGNSMPSLWDFQKWLILLRSLSFDQVRFKFNVGVNSPSPGHALSHLIFCKVNSLVTSWSSKPRFLYLSLDDHVTFEGNNTHSLFRYCQLTLACSCALFQRLDEYPLKSVKDLFTTPATEGKKIGREKGERKKLSFFFNSVLTSIYTRVLWLRDLKMTPHIVMN